MSQTKVPSAQEMPAPSLPHQILKLLFSLAIGALLLFGAYRWWVYEGEHPSTENAYLNAHFVWVSPRVTGQVLEVMVDENQSVEAGADLFRIDPAPFRAELERAEAVAELVTQENAIDKAAVAAAKAGIGEQQALLDAAKEQAERIHKLVEKGDVPVLQGIQSRDQYLAAQASLRDAQAQHELALRKLGPPEVQQARVRQAQVAVELAKLNLDWTLVKAPAAGTVSRLTLRPGDMVQAGQSLFPFVETAQWWVEANFKETQIAGIGVGMKVAVTIDIYADRPFSGVVESLGPASAASFSLLPAQNTTGNWVKVTQRIPVRIRMEPMDPDFPYRIGASARVEVILESQPAAKSRPGVRTAEPRPVQD